MPIILFNANRDLQRVLEETSANAFVEKPFDLVKMAKVVMELLDTARFNEQ